ncbi:serine protease [Pedobacter frigoris]|uniref:S1 family peptidase n=1 Tax=Pedobacter frigoris TaxID=2571272 RepID=UPI00292D415F|nr:trypsin-like peptidase domain-containing protein [Pedobacter frigoris]
MKKLIVLLVCMQMISPVFAQNDVFNAGQLEGEVKLNIEKAYAASVRIANLDASQQAVGGYFSGVVVDAEGHILTAAHAVDPNKLYLVEFPDGRQYKAKGLGNIHSIDAAMMVITEKGKWPFAKMGWTSLLEPNVPCLSISYPGSFVSKKPTIRFGYVAELKHKTGFMRTTCLMEPGDSGGPVFDLKGRVIGIHSRVSVRLDENLEVPVDNFRKYWTALKTPAVHTAFIPEDEFKVDKKAEPLKPVPQMPALISSFEAQDLALKKNVFTLRDSLNTGMLSTLINLTGLVPESNLKGKSFLISKSSMTGANPKVEMADGRMVAAKIISRDEASDLVLLQVSQEIGGGIDLSRALASYTADQLGNFLISPKPKAEAELSVLGNIQVRIPKSPARYLGIETSFNQADHKIVVTGLHPLPAEKENAKADDIAVKDQLTKINDRLILNVGDLPEELSKYETGQTVTLAYAKPGGGVFSRSIVLKPRYVEPNTSKDLFLDGKSLRRDDFKEVLIHDGKLKPSECGGPLFDVKGNFYGINTARLSRTSSLAIPAPVIVQFVKEISGQLQ